MKILPCYKNRIINLPAEAVLTGLSTATREELAVLIAVSAEPDFDVSALSARLNITESTLISAVSAWTRKGVITVVETTETKETPESPEAQVSSESKAAAEKPAESAPRDVPAVKKVAAVRSAVLPHYTTDETAAYLEQNPSFTSLIDSCQMILGKVFNTAVSHKQEKIHSSQNQHIICYKLPPIVCSFHRLYPLYNYMELLDIT